MVLGEALIAQGDSRGGIRELESARTTSPQMVRIHWDLMRAYTAEGMGDKAAREKAEIERLSRYDAAN